jgi:adenylylsulfate kinase-like enzyme
VCRRREFLLYGLGGSGKSQIAMKFAEENKERLVPAMIKECSSSALEQPSI